MGMAFPKITIRLIVGRKQPEFDENVKKRKLQQKITTKRCWFIA